MTVKRSKKRAAGAATSSRAKRSARDEQLARSAAVLWKAIPAPRRGPKAALTIERIATAAIAIADAEGLDAVSMSRVAEGFDFTTMSLYRYVPGKAELVHLMFDTAMGAPPDFSSRRGGWRAKLEAWGRALWSLLIEHPWALDVLTQLRLPGPNELAWMECGAHALADTGLTGAPVLDSLFLVVGQVRIVAQYAVVRPETSESLSTDEWARGVGALLDEHAAEFPALTTAMSAGAFAPVEDPLEFGLDRVLDGIQLLVDRTGH